MGTVERAISRGNRLGRRAIAMFGEEVREARIGLSLSQGAVGEKVQMSASSICRIEQGTVPNLGIADAARIGAVLGLDLKVLLYPGGAPIRDAAQSRYLTWLIAQVGRPLSCRTEVLLPPTATHTEQRAWDAAVYGTGKKTVFEVELRLRDGQAAERRLALKMRDDPADSTVLVLADTRSNRRVLKENPHLFAYLPRLAPREVLEPLRRGEHPPSGLILLAPPATARQKRRSARSTED